MKTILARGICKRDRWPRMLLRTSQDLSCWSLQDLVSMPVGTQALAAFCCAKAAKELHALAVG